MPAAHAPRATRSRDVEKGTSMTDTSPTASPTASGSPSPRRGRVFRAAAPRQPQKPQPVLDERLTAPAGYGSSAAPPSGHDRAATPVGAPAPYTGTQGDVHAEVLVLGAGPGRLHRRVPRRRPRQDSRDGRLPRPTGRGVPQRRLHPEQSAAARRQGDRRNQGDDPRRAGLPRPHHRPGCPARLEGQRRHPAHRRPDRPGQTTQSPNPGRHRHLHLTEHALASPARTAPPPPCPSTRRSSPPAPNRSPCRSSRTTTPG